MSTTRAATRTQVYLTESQRARIDREAETKGVTMAEVIRRAIDQYLEEDIDPTATLASTFGAQPSAETPSRSTWRRG